MKNDKLVREYVRQILLEEFGDYSSGSSYVSGGSGYGGTAIKAAFVDPVSDIFKILKGRAKELFSGVKRLARVSLSGMLGLLTAGLWEPNYKAAKSVYNNEISKIRSEYAGARASGVKALLSNDLLAIGMFYHPALVLAARVIENQNKSNNILKEEKPKKEKPTKLPAIPEELTKKAQQATDIYFDKIKNDLLKVKYAKSLQDLDAPKEILDKLSAELSKSSNEEEKKQIEEKFLKAAKEHVFMASVKTLKQERDRMVNAMKEAGVSSAGIFDSKGLPARYSEEIKKIAAMIGVSVKE